MDTKQSTTSRRGLHPKQLYRRPGGLLITALVVLAGAVLAVAFAVPKGERIDHTGYQVVYLVSGQAYFGKLQSIGGDYMVLKQAYTTQDQASGQDNIAPQTAIIKVSQQVYGPTDTISLKSEQVVFWQNLRSDSKVVQAIKNSAK